jgi:hypothetical protein
MISKEKIYNYIRKLRSIIIIVNGWQSLVTPSIKKSKINKNKNKNKIKHI